MYITQTNEKESFNTPKKVTPRHTSQQIPIYLPLPPVRHNHATNLPRVSQKWSQKRVLSPEYRLPEIITKETYPWSWRQRDLVDSRRLWSHGISIQGMTAYWQPATRCVPPHVKATACTTSASFHFSLSLSLLEAIFMYHCTAIPWKWK